MTDLNLRVVARVEDPSKELFEYLAIKEGVVDPTECWVDLALPRDFEWSDEIRESAVEFGIADLEGNILATFDTMQKAEEAKGKARISIALSFEDEPVTTAKAGSAKVGGSKVDEFLSTTGRAPDAVAGA